MRVGALLSLLVLPALNTFPAAQVAGTYRLTICVRPCTEGDTGVVRGQLVLFANPVRLNTLPDTIRAALTERVGWLLRPSEAPNACFALPSGPSHVQGRELYAGIIRRSFTHWHDAPAGITVLLYRSPDAFYSLVGTIDSSRFRGRGEQGNCCGGDPPVTYFLAHRVGEADVNSCMMR
jgi:hypothetical protein